MADNEDIGINVKVRGLDQAGRSLKDLVSDVKRAERGMERAQGGARPRSDREGPSTRQPGGSGPSISGNALGVFAGNMMTQAFSALQQSVTQAFDPLSTRQERQARLIQAGLGIIPGIGTAASSIFGTLAENQLAPGRNTAQRIGQILDPAIRASGLTDPEEIRKRFGADIRALRDLYLPQEKASRAGQQAIADEIGKDLDLNQVKDDALNQLKRIADDLGIPIDVFENASQNFERNVESFSAAVSQIVEHWQGVLRGDRAVFEGVRR